MKKILFVVCTHGDELAGLNLFLKYPYGKNANVEWKVLVGNPEATLLNLRYFETNLNRAFDSKLIKSYEEKRAKLLKKIMVNYDVVYDVHTTTDIRSSEMWNRCLFINSLNKNTLEECDYISANHIIWDKDTTNPDQFLPYHAKVGITIEYVKTGNALLDMKRIEKDFLQIIRQKKIASKTIASRILFEGYLPVTHKQQKKLGLILKEFTSLTNAEKKKLNLQANHDYQPVFINPVEADPINYCFLNIRIDSKGKRILNSG